MKAVDRRTQIAFAVAGVLSAATMTAAIAKDSGGSQPLRGTYATGDFHNHTTCSDGSISMQKLVKKSMDKQDTPWGLDWFVQAGHGGSGNRNCTLVEDATLSTPAYPYVEGRTPGTTWAASIGAAAVKGNTGSSDGSSTTPLSSLANPSMWRWQSIQEYQYPVTEYLAALKQQPVFMGLESVVAGHEHTSMTVITGQQIPNKAPQNGAGYVPVGDAVALAKWSYCFDRGDTDNSRGGGQNWDCSVPGSANEADPSWRANAAKLMPAGGAGSGERGHAKTVEGVKWMAANHGRGSYYVPAHLERAGPFNPDGNNGFNVEHLRNFNNAGPTVAFGMETQPGHGASGSRGEYRQDRNSIGGVRVDSVGGTTWGGTGVYGAQIGGVWDAMLGEGRNWWFFASSDWHNRGNFGPDDRRTTQDFYPGEYQRDYVMIQEGKGRSKARRKDQLTPQEIVDGLRSGNSWTDSGQLVDRLAFVACTCPEAGPKDRAEIEAAALKAAMENSDVKLTYTQCATMGEKLRVKHGEKVIVAVAVRDPDGINYAPYTFDNPSLAQIGVEQPLNAPVLDHVDLIRGLVTGYKTPGAADYAGAWPDNWVENPDMDTVPAAAKNTSAAVVRSFDSSSWKEAKGKAHKGFKTMSYVIEDLAQSQYVRLRGTNLPPAVPFETDASGNPLSDLYTNGDTPAEMRIPCTSSPSTPVPADATYTGTQIDGCPEHMERYPAVTGPKYSSYDVASWADLWFYSNPIYIEVKGGTLVAGVK